MAVGAVLHRNLASSAVVIHPHENNAIDIQMIMPRCPGAHLPSDPPVGRQTPGHQPVLQLGAQLTGHEGRQGNGLPG